MQGNSTWRTGESGSAPAEGGASPSPRILVADDEVILRHWCAALLVQSGYEVDTAADGELAWQMLQMSKYDLLLTDHSMPALTGLELVQLLRCDKVALPVIMMSGTMPMEELNREPSLQLAATLPKPFSGAELVGLVKKVLSGSDSAREPAAAPPNGQHQAPSGESPILVNHASVLSSGHEDLSRKDRTDIW